MRKNEIGITIVIVCLAALWKGILLGMDAFPFNSDEAIVALMARHILSGARPIFFYGQAYMGAVDAYLVSATFAWLGQSVLSIRVTQLVLYLATIITTIAIGKVVLGSFRAGWMAGLILAVPTVNMTLYTTVSLGGYGEALLIGNLILLVGGVLIKREQTGHHPHPLWYAVLGLLMGLGLWTNGLTLVYSLPVGVAVAARILNIKKNDLRGLSSVVVFALAGFVIGSLPWWIYAAQNGFQALVNELLGSAVAVESSTWLEVLGQHVVNLLLLGLPALMGIRPPWEVRWLILPLIPFILSFWIFVMVYFVRITRKGFKDSFFPVLMGICGVFLTAFLFTPFGVDPSGRYFLPLYVILALVAGRMLDETVSKKWQVIILSLVVLYQGWGTWECAQLRVPGITTQFDTSTVIDASRQGELIQFLKAQGETRGYTHYWVAYPLAFLSNEEVIFSPRLPYHQDLRYTSRDDRYPIYTQLVDASVRVAYITTQQAELVQRLREELTKNGVLWEEKVIGDYRVFYGLSKKVMPAQLIIYPSDREK